MKKRRKVRKRKAKTKAARDRKLHVSLNELHDWMARGEKLFAPVLAGGEEISRAMRDRVRKGLTRLKGQTDRMVESWEKEMAAHLERKDR